MSVMRPQVPQYVTLQILAILQPYPPHERADMRPTDNHCLGSDLLLRGICLTHSLTSHTLNTA